MERVYAGEWEIMTKIDQINDAWLHLLMWEGGNLRSPQDFERAGIDFNEFKKSVMWISWRAWVLRGFKNYPDCPLGSASV